jgi:hypothetical protein
LVGGTWLFWCTHSVTRARLHCPHSPLPSGGKTP